MPFPSFHPLSLFPIPHGFSIASISCQKEMDSVRFRVPVTKRPDTNRSVSVKKQAGELPLWSVSPPWHPFSCGKNGIFSRKEIPFFPQSDPQGCGKRGETKRRTAFSLLFGDRPRTRPACLFASLSHDWLTRGWYPFRTASQKGVQSVAEIGSRLSFCISENARDSRISVHSRP